MQLDASGNVIFGAGTTIPGTMTASGNFVPPYSFFRNRVINGNMAIDQRFNGAVQTATVLNTLTYVIDRWAYQVSAASKFTLAQYAMSTTPANTVSYPFTNYLGAISLSAYTPATSDFFYVEQPIEGSNTSDLGWGTINAENVTLSFYVYASASGTYSGAVTNNAKTRSYPFSFTVATPATWARVVVTIPGDQTGAWLQNSTGAGIRVRFNLGAGSTFTGASGAWASANYVGANATVGIVATSAAFIYITGVQLEDGSVATPYEEPLEAVQLVNCLRYYQKSFPQTVAAAQNAGLTGALTFGQIVAASTATAGGPVFFKVTMRATPTTLTLYNPSAANAQIRNVTVPSDFTLSTAVNTSDSGFGFTATAPAATAAGNQCAFHYAADAEIA